MSNKFKDLFVVKRRGKNNVNTNPLILKAAELQAKEDMMKEGLNPVYTELKYKLKSKI